MNDFAALLDELGFQDRQRSAGGGGRSDNVVVHRQAPAVRPDVYFRQPTPDRHFAKAIGADLANIRATQAETAASLLADQAANLKSRQRAIVTEARGVLMKCAQNGSMTATEVAAGEAILHRAVDQFGL